MQSKDNKIIKQKKLHPPHGRGEQSSESLLKRASVDQKQRSESNKTNQGLIHKEYELSSYCFRST